MLYRRLRWRNDTILTYKYPEVPNRGIIYSILKPIFLETFGNHIVFHSFIPENMGLESNLMIWGLVHINQTELEQETFHLVEIKWLSRQQITFV